MIMSQQELTPKQMEFKQICGDNFDTVKSLAQRLLIVNRNVEKAASLLWVSALREGKMLEPREILHLMKTANSYLDIFPETEPAAKKYVLYQPEGGTMNLNCTPSAYKYQEKVEYFAEDLEGMYRTCQIGANTYYHKRNIRSASVGDILFDKKEEQAYLITGSGFKEISWNFCTEVVPL